MYFLEELNILLKARFPFLYILTNEEERLEYTIRKQFSTMENTTVYSWNFIDGYTGNPSFQGLGNRNPLQALEVIEQLPTKSQAIFILKDFDKFFSDISIICKLKNLNRTLKNQQKTIIICTNELNLPNDISQLFSIIEFQLPNKYEIKTEVSRLLKLINYEPTTITVDAIVRASQGLTIEKIRRSLSKALMQYKTINHSTIEYILKEKRQIVQQTQLLEFVDTKTSILDVGGLEQLKSWLRIRKNVFKKSANIYGLNTPRGLLIVGVQGTGKSLMAKAIAHDWQLPLLKLDAGRLFNGIIGESEKNVRQMIKISEAMSPCILWIDEIEKAFFDSSKTNDSGTTTRVLATMLAWLAEKQESVFVVATANNLDRLPLEMIRRGRFDEIFFVNLPSYLERKLILKVFLKKIRPTSWQKFELDKLSLQTKGFSGAEIEQAIQEALYTAFANNLELQQDTLEQAIKNITPLAQINPNVLREMEQWALNGQIRKA